MNYLQYLFQLPVLRWFCSKHLAELWNFPMFWVSPQILVRTTDWRMLVSKIIPFVNKIISFLMYSFNTCAVLSSICILKNSRSRVPFYIESFKRLATVSQIEATWMSRWKLGSMVRINGFFHLLINGVYWGCHSPILTFDPNFLGHPSGYFWTPKLKLWDGQKSYWLATSESLWLATSESFPRVFSAPYVEVSPIPSMYGIFTYIYQKNQPNVGKYTIHGRYGTYVSPTFPK